jgi:hypothetical protein
MVMEYQKKGERMPASKKKETVKVEKNKDVKQLQEIVVGLSGRIKNLESTLERIRNRMGL